MLQKKYGALPTIIIAVQNKVVRAKRLGLFNHYLNHKGTDIPNGRRNSTNKTVLECIVASFNRYYQPETCKRKISHKSLATDDSLEDLRSVAHIAVWKATEKYISGINKKKENKEIHIDYKDRFDFCIFASQQVKFKLRTHLRLLNIDRIYSKLPYSNKARKLYSILPNWK